MEPTTGPPSILSVPFQLRANDVVKHIINVDSRFRLNPERTSAADFVFVINPPVKNILRIRITSVEIPNNYPVFTALRKSVTLRVLYKDASGAGQAVLVTIPEGNYTGSDMVDALNAEFLTVSGGAISWITVAFDDITGRFTFIGTGRYFGLDMTYDTFDRPFDYGLGFHLGFSRRLHVASGIGGGKYELVSDQCATFAGDPYVLLRVNDFRCVRHPMTDSTLTALAKIVLREPKNYMVYDDYASQHAKEVVFPSPQNLSRLTVQLVDPYGQPLEMCEAQISFSIEALEIRNSTLYRTIQDSMALQYL